MEVVFAVVIVQTGAGLVEGVAMKFGPRVFFLALSLIFATMISRPAHAASDDPSLARLLNAINDAGGTLTSADVQKILKDPNALLAQTGASRSRQLWCDSGECNLIFEDQAGNKVQIDVGHPGSTPIVLASAKPPAPATSPAPPAPPAPAAPTAPAPPKPPASPTPPAPVTAPTAASQTPPPDGLDTPPPLLDSSDSVSEGPPATDQQQPEADQGEPGGDEQSDLQAEEQQSDADQMESGDEQPEMEPEDQQPDADQMEAGDEQQPEMESEDQAESSEEPPQAEEETSRSSRSYPSRSPQKQVSSKNSTTSIRIVTPEGKAELIDATGTTLFEGSMSKRNGLTVFSGTSKTGQTILLTERGTGMSASEDQATVFDPMGSFKLETDKNGDLIIHNDQGRTYTGKKNGAGQMVITDPEANSATIVDNTTFRIADSTGHTILEGNLNKISELAVAHYGDAFPHRLEAKPANP